MAAVAGEPQTGDILVVAAEYSQQSTCGHLDQSGEGVSREARAMAEGAELGSFSHLPQIEGVGHGGNEVEAVGGGTQTGDDTWTHDLLLQLVLQAAGGAGKRTRSQSQGWKERAYRGAPLIIGTCWAQKAKAV